MTEAEQLAHDIDKVRRRQARLIRFMTHYAGQLAVMDDDLCGLLRHAAQMACDAGQIGGDVTAAVIAPKDDPEP